MQASSSSPIRWTPSRAFVAGVVASVAMLDLGTGAWLLTADAPWLAHGSGTVWLDGSREVQESGPLATVLLSLWRRMGAFSVFAGITTLVWLWRGLRDRSTLTTLLIVYIVAGLGFGYTDNTFFAGTPYALFKQTIGGFWVTALALHLWSARAQARVATT
jgi:hypothetical protein